MMVRAAADRRRLHDGVDARRLEHLLDSPTSDRRLTATSGGGLLARVAPSGRCRDALHAPTAQRATRRDLSPAESGEPKLPRFLVFVRVNRAREDERGVHAAPPAPPGGPARVSRADRCRSAGRTAQAMTASGLSNEDPQPLLRPGRSRPSARPGSVLLQIAAPRRRHEHHRRHHDRNPGLPDRDS
jgi:hypothetical protein